MKRTMRRRAAGGFTVIEVMVSIGIMMIGAMAVIGLQTQAIRANSYARQVTTATQIAQTWTERLKEDACLWTQRAAVTPEPPETVLAAVALANTSFLRSILAQRGEWVSPNATAPPVSRGFDFHGRDVSAVAGVTPPPFFYCAAYRLNWVFFGEAVRADVRVWWPRAGSSADLGTDFPGCAAAGGGLNALDPGGTAANNYHAVFVSTVMRVTTLNR
jgi:type II secretory pathway pseudopilin PulG